MCSASLMFRLITEGSFMVATPQGSNQLACISSRDVRKEGSDVLRKPEDAPATAAISSSRRSRVQLHRQN